MSLGIMNKVIVKQSGIERKGLFALKNIKKGKIVVTWKPIKIISKRDFKKLSEDEQNHTTPAGNGKYIVMGIPERYVNHSCSPNTYANKKRDIALRNIKENEEITSDYSINGIDAWKMNCLCRSRNCRKIIYNDFFKLPKAMQKKYLPYLEDWFKKKFKDKLKGFNAF